MDGINRLVHTLPNLKVALARRSGEAVVIVPAPEVPIGVSEIYRMLPGFFSSAPEDWSSKEQKISSVDPYLARDRTAPAAWYLLRVPQETYWRAEAEQKLFAHPEFETVPDLATFLWVSVAFASCRKWQPLMQDGRALRTSTTSSDGGRMIVLASGKRLVVSDCLGPEGDIGMPFLQCIALPSA
ncbi:MAG: hypothetical protein HGB37_01915 [Candidatus Moranbacteria bacterium]|nr:hypothetical protein [Candidatus Moranbacteria bacterium]